MGAGQGIALPDHPSEEYLSPGALDTDPSDEDLSPGTPDTDPSDEDLSPGTPDTPARSMQVLRCQRLSRFCVLMNPILPGSRFHLGTWPAK